jgi:predicted nucleotidyltransferase
MTRAEAIAALAPHADELKARGATALYLFGSTARDEAGSDSDLDLFIEYDTTRKFSLLDLVGIQHFLQDALPVRVDVTTRDSLHRVLKADIERSAVRVF